MRLRTVTLAAAGAAALVLAVLLLTGVLAGHDDTSERGAPVPAMAKGQARSFALRRVASGLVRPTYVSTAPGDGRALWVLEQNGRVSRIAGGARSTVLDLRAEVKIDGEQGLLGMAFHPDFARNGRLFVHYSDRRGDTSVEEYRARGAARQVDRGSRRKLLFVDQPEENHNGGALVFGPDGRMYLGLGDGGGAFDPNRTAQNLRSKLGKLLALDVDRRGAPRWEVAAYGLRNPWRFSFDTALGELWVADVGQDRTEEVNRLLLEPDEPPKNLGWSEFEGVDRVASRRIRGTGELVWPVAAYTHKDGCSITGGLVYRGTALPRLAGRYVYGDFCSGKLWSLRPAPAGRAADVRSERASLPQLTHIGTDARGELLLASGAGDVYRAVAPPGDAPD